MKRKTVAIVLSAMMVITALGGCGSTTANVESEKLEESQKAGEDRTAQSEGLAPLTFVRAQDSTVESSVFAKMEGSTYEDNIWTDLIAEKLGYDVTYLWIASDGDLYKQKFNAAISSGEIPDIASVGKEDLKRLVDADLIVDLKPYIDDEENLSYRVENGIFKNFCETARTRPSEQFVFIIDEINRGNISKIFGELITLIEQSKRQGGTDEIEVVLPYSNEKFSVPNNVYILGTMNTADKSIQVLDTALRRRFFFKEILPDETIFKNIKVGNIEIEKMLKKMNERIAILLDKNHMIGHAYFIPLLTDSSILTLSSIFQNSIIPLLEEYFYDDYSEVMKILNIDPENSDEKKLISVMDTEESLFVIQDESENMRYSINYSEFKTEDNYIRIYNEI